MSETPIDGQNIESTVVIRQGRTLTADERATVNAIQFKGAEFRALLNRIAAAAGPSRELSIAKTKIDEAIMWAASHIEGGR